LNPEVKVLHPTKQVYPPMHALRALEAFARLGTVWEAAEELGITRSALSHRLAMLESVLGFDVAVRSGKGVALTPRGRRYAQDVQKSLELLRGAHDDDSRPLEGNLCISSTPGFAAMWLCNHIASFQIEHPDLNLQIVVNRELDQASDRHVDLFIVFGEGSWPKQHVQHLYDVEFLPMCSPALLNMHAGLKEPADLLRFPLLHLNDWEDWRQWMAAVGMELPRRAAGIRFSDLMMVQTAAISGQGTMMGDVITCAGALSSGQLVTPFPVKVKARGAYYLVRSGQKRPSLAVSAFTRWLRSLFKRVNPELQVGTLS
jgi:LysR family transcriptional regulator, glycine cleavage system transcriptional activator